MIRYNAQSSWIVRLYLKKKIYLKENITRFPSLVFYGGLLEGGHKKKCIDINNTEKKLAPGKVLIQYINFTVMFHS